MLGPHGYLHGGIQVSIADSLAGYGTAVNLPAGSRRTPNCRGPLDA
jgi:acyl-coenzyme A thioesterase PaaI-like protein